MTNKTNEVLKHLQREKSITSIEAIKYYGATRLSAIIFKLKNNGYNIITKREESIDRYGNTCRFARYIYLGKQKSDKDFFEKIFGDVFPSIWRKK